MKNNISLTLFTATFNRADRLPCLYDSLCRQTCFDFEWLVVDDGSIDNTSELFEKWTNETRFSVRYYKKENGGKHTALNLGFDEAKGEYFLCVDSDDFLIDDAVNTILQDWKGCENANLCAITYLKGYDRENYVGQKFHNDYEIGNYIDVRINEGIDGDKAEVWDTRKLRQFKFPVFEGERFFAEGFIWYQLALKYDMLFVNKIIYVCEYLEGGLSRSGRKLRVTNPQGGMANALMQMHPRSKNTHRIKYAILYDTYALFANKGINEILGGPYSLLRLMCLPISWLLFWYWKSLYINE